MAGNDRVGDVYLDVKPRDTGFERGVQSIIDKAEKNARISVGANTSTATKAVDQLANDITTKIGGAWAQSAVEAAAFTASIYGIKAAVEGVVNKFSELFDGLAKARAGFNSILGEKAGSGLLAQVRQFAIDSPFVTSELVQYSQQLLGVGKAANTIVPTLKNVGDIVASVGGDTSNLGSILYALTQIQTIGKLTGQDARQLQNQLVPITKYISEYTGKSVADVKKLQEAGGVSSDIVFKAIENQGKKVEGALNNSVRTIQGAKSVLSDTFKNFIQSNPALNGIYDDLVKGIQKFAAYISKPEIKRYIDEFLASVGKLYESIKPIITQFGALASSGGLTALSGVTRVLSTLAKIIDSFPAPVLSLIATSLAALAAIKAPLALIQYAGNIQRITTGLLGSNGIVSGLTRGTTAFAAQTAVTEASAVAANGARVAYAALGAQMVATAEEASTSSNVIRTSTSFRQGLKGLPGQAGAGIKGFFGGLNPQTLGIGASVAGGLVSSNASQTNAPAQGLGNALTYGGIGLALGGPVGGAVGAAYGALTGFLDAQDKKLEEQIDKNRELGKKAAQAYLNENAKLFSTATSESVNRITTDLVNTKAAINEIETQRKRNNANANFDPLNFLPGPSVQDKNNAEAKKRNALLEDTLAEQKAIYDKFAQPILDVVKKLREEGDGASFLKNLASPASVGSNPVKEIQDLELAFRQFGLTLNDVVNDPAGAEALVHQINSLDTAQKNATVTANLYAAALKDNIAQATAVYGTEISNLGAKLSKINAVETARKAAIASIKPGQSGAEQEVSKLTAQQTKDQAILAITAQAITDSQIASDEALVKAKKTGNTALAESITKGKESNATAAAAAAVQQFLTSITASQTLEFNQNTEARIRANKVAEKALELATLQGKISTFGATASATGAAIQSAINPTNANLRDVAKAAILQAQQTAGNAAAAAASAKQRKELQDLAFQPASDNLDARKKELEGKILITEETARTSAETRILAQIEADAAFARGKYNADTQQFLTNLQRGQQVSSALFGNETAKAQSEVSRFAAIESAGSAVAKVFSENASASSLASLEVAALGAKTAQFNIIFAETGSIAAATAAAQDTYNSIILDSQTKIDNVVNSVIGLNKQLNTVDGRKAVAEVVVDGIQKAENEINNLKVLIASLTAAGPQVSKNRAGPNAVDGEKPLTKAELDKLKFAQAATANLNATLGALRGGADTNGTLSGVASDAFKKLTPDKEKKEKIDHTAEKAAKALEDATNALADKLQSAADNIVAAAEKWVGSIKERTQYETAVSASRLTNNANRQAKDLTEITSGLANLRGRGVDQKTLDALGINNISDTRQVRKLVKSSDSDLAALTAAVSNTGNLAQTLAISEEDRRTRNNIRDAIIEAATKLDIKLSKDQAVGISNQFNITPGINPDDVAVQILNILSGAKISR